MLLKLKKIYLLWDVEDSTNREDYCIKYSIELVTKELIEDTTLNSASQIIYEKIIEIYENKVEEVKKIGFDFAIYSTGQIDLLWINNVTHSFF